MIKKILIDIGSSTVKVYEQTQGKVSQIFARSISFKSDFDPIKGISEDSKKELYELIKEVQEKNKESQIKIFATAVFRKMEKDSLKNFIDEFFIRTGLYFNVVPHDLESFYLQVALVGKYEGKEPIMLINIGGGSTELVVMYGKEAIETKNIDLGVGTLLGKFDNINDKKSGVSLDEVKKFVLEQLPDMENKPKVAIYSGGELNYMNLAGYKLTSNNLFKDTDHPSVISTKDFADRNNEVFEKVTLEELEGFMPENPKWMHGARACSALAQAICEKYGIETIVPSDSNLIDGVARQEFRYVTLSGSFRKHLEYIVKVRNEFVEKGTEVLSPRFTEPKNPGEEFVVFSGEEGLAPLELERHHLDSIDNSDALIVCDPEGYVGASALIEIGYAHALGKRVIFVEKPEEFMLNTLPSEVGL